MMHISFGHTTPALVTGNKTVTRRDWKPRHAAHFRAGMVCGALNTDQRVGGQKVGEIRLTADPVYESTALAPDTDWWAEGFDFMHRRDLLVFGAGVREVWRQWLYEAPVTLWVVRFELLGLTPFGEELCARWSA